MMNLLRWFPYKIRLFFDPTIDKVSITIFSASIANDAALAVQQLEGVQKELSTALASIESLRIDAVERLRESEDLREQIARLTDDKKAAEAMLEVPQDAVTRLVSRANRRGAWRGRMEGAFIGFLTGAASSFLVWWLTQ